MVITSKQAEQEAVLSAAKQMCAAARTAPKTQGKDYLETCILAGEELEKLAQHMEMLGNASKMPFIIRDAGNIRKSGAVVLLGVRNVVHGMNETCNYCGQGNCKGCTQSGSLCAYAPIDLGIAIGSAVAVAADNRIDSRVMFSAGRAAADLGYLPEGYGLILAIPLSASGKSPYFDRK